MLEEYKKRVDRFRNPKKRWVIIMRATKSRNEEASAEIKMLKKENEEMKRKLCEKLEIEKIKYKTAEDRIERLETEIYDLKRLLEGKGWKVESANKPGAKSQSKASTTKEEDTKMAISRKKSLRSANIGCFPTTQDDDRQDTILDETEEETEAWWVENGDNNDSSDSEWYQVPSGMSTEDDDD
ncbi:hypothetical protein ALC62_15004 [Cyphomyrmex costatus]|uniref:Uncharacterized protein n=1 Tax=Cyphomyrmex costatus TaxID=456900 RepID=A0A151I8D0_9HYME|nr:hypothetical protein ALC62_15004 [Cyphomyrmex costatus]